MANFERCALVPGAFGCLGDMFLVTLKTFQAGDALGSTVPRTEAYHSPSGLAARRPLGLVAVRRSCGPDSKRIRRLPGFQRLNR